MLRKPRLDAPGVLHVMGRGIERTEIFRDDPYLLDLSRYIHLNPLRARKIFSQLAVKRMGYSGAEIARYLGVTTSAVNRITNSEEFDERQLEFPPLLTSVRSYR